MDDGSTMTLQVVESRWTFQTSRIYSFAWTPDGEYLASGSLDTSICLWCVKKPQERVGIRNAVPGGVNAVAWAQGGRRRQEGDDCRRRCGRLREDMEVVLP